MPVITVGAWKEATLAAVPALKQSQSLKDLTTKLEVLAQRPTQASLDTVKSLVTAWEKAEARGEVLKMNKTILDLKMTITDFQTKVTQSAPNPALTSAKGYTFVVDLDGDNPLPPNECLKPLTQPEVARINEAFARAKLAVELARDAIIPIAKKDALVNPNPTEQLFIDYFGAYDKTRAGKILDRYKKLCTAFTNPEVVDHRNTDGSDCFAYTHSKQLNQWPGQRVRVWLCRDFFAQGKAAYPKGANPDTYKNSYAKTSDATLGTLVHEFCHGVFDAADAPQWVNGSWVPGAPDGNGDSPNNDIQSSTRPLDKALAVAHPNIALQNADNYGQFACEVAVAKGK